MIPEATRPERKDEAARVHTPGYPLVKRTERAMPLQEKVMRMFDVQGIEIVATRAKVFEFLKEPGNLP